MMTRRILIAAFTGSLAALDLGLSQTTFHVVVLGDGFGGDTVERTLRRLAPEVAVTLIERDTTFHT